MGNIEHDGLKEEHEADPLVPGMPDLITIRSDFDQVGVGGGREVMHGGNTWIGYLGSDLAYNLVGDGKGALDPAVRVHDI